MSYIYQFWDPTPEALKAQDIEQLSQWIEAAQETEPGRNPRYLELARKFAQRYPMKPEGEEFERSVWRSWPLDEYEALGDGAVFSVALNTQFVVDVRSYLSTQAQQLNLIAYDPQAGEAYLPGGRVLSAPPSAPSAKDTTVRGTPAPDIHYEFFQVSEIMGILIDRFDALMLEHGLQAQPKEHDWNRSYRRKTDQGWVGIDFLAGDSYFSIWAKVHMPPVYRLYWALRSPECFPRGFSGIPELPDDAVPEHAKNGNSFQWDLEQAQRSLGPDRRISLSYRFPNRAVLKEKLELAAQQLIQHMLPSLVQAETLKGLDVLLCPPDLTTEEVMDRLNNSGHYSDLVLLLYLMRNPKLHDVIAYLTNPIRATSYRSAADVIKYVLENPEPPPLD